MSSDESVEQLFDGSGPEAPLPGANDQDDNDTTSDNDMEENNDSHEESVDTRGPVTPANARQSVVDVMPSALDWPYQGLDPTCVQCSLVYDPDERRVCPCEQTYCEYCLRNLVEWMVMFDQPLPIYHCGRPLPNSPCDCEVCCTNSDDESTYCLICRLPEHWWKNEVPDLVPDN